MRFGSFALIVSRPAPGHKHRRPLRARSRVARRRGAPRSGRAEGRRARPLWPPRSPPPASLSLIHISEPTRLGMISYAVFCLKKKKKKTSKTTNAREHEKKKKKKKSKKQSK